MSDPCPSIWDQALPIFPLPNCVLLPGGLLPLHLFEPRYRKMMQGVLEQDAAERYMAMALLREGYEPLYHTNQAPIHPIVCVGSVIQYEELDDGRYNLILLGRTRAAISIEDHTGPYRTAVLRSVDPGVLPMPDDAASLRYELHQLLREAATLGLVAADAVEKVFDAHGSIEALLDVVAFYFIPSDAFLLKQRLLETRDIVDRADLVRRWIQALIERRQNNQDQDSSSRWPPPISTN
jgi:Lon protease-like protein